VTRTTRLVGFAVAGGATAVLLVLGVLGLPHFGAAVHPFRDHSVPAAVAHRTANVVSAINYDQRGLDTLGEETILLASALGVSTLLRPGRREHEREPSTSGRVMESTRLLGYVFLPLCLIIGIDTVVHGALTPGGGFQGGVVLGTGIHLLYVAGSYRALERLRPVRIFEVGEAVGAGAFACVGLAGAFAATSFLGNLLPWGVIGTLFSGGTVLLLSTAVGIEVASSVVVLLAAFLGQAIEIEDRG
jgi:multicomponent Na+:H+ antiporter subunit B